MQNRVTIQDVAEMAKVSKVTVSYVLNGRDAAARISAETKARVLDAAKQLGYRPSAVARMLVNRRSGTIAVVFQYAQYFSTWSSFTSDVMHGVCEAAVDADIDIMLHTKVASDMAMEANQLMDGRADGALLLRDGNDPLVAELVERQFPCVLFFTRSYLPGTAFVDADNYAGGRIATQHLIDLGHRRIGMIRGSSLAVSSTDRYNGYREALESANLAVDPRDVVQIAAPDGDIAELKDLLARPDRPTALFIWSDDVAYRVLAVAKSMGIRVPDQLSIVGFDSLNQSSFCNPPLTSVKQPVAEMAREATEMLVAQINGDPLKRTQTIYPLSLDIRSSTAPYHR